MNPYPPTANSKTVAQTKPIIAIVNVVASATIDQKLISTKKDQKDVNSGYKETIKDIESEIKAIIEDYSVNGTGVANP